MRAPTWNWLPFEPVDFKLAETMRAYWTNFAKSGNPNAPELPGWSPFDIESKSAMGFGKHGDVKLRHSQPTFCKLDLAGLKQRLSEASVRHREAPSAAKTSK